MCSKDEMMKRIGLVHSDMSMKLQDRPTLTYFKKVLTAYDQKIEQFNISLNDQIGKIDLAQAD